MRRAAEAWERFWFRETPLVRLALFRIGILTLALADLLAYGATALRDAQAVTDGAVHKSWSPIYLFELLHLQPIGIGAARVVFAAAIACVALGLVGLFTRAACLGSAALSTYLTGLVYSFGKIHHDKVALTFALWALPLAPVGARLSLDAFLARRRSGAAPPDTSPFAGLPMRVTQVTIALGYGFAGWTKLRVSGLEWANGYSLMGILARYDNVLSQAATQSAAFCRFMSIGTLAVQCLFPIALFWRRSRWFLLPCAVLFHVGTWWTMDTGPYITLWFCLIAFLPLERIPAWTRDGLRARSLPRKLFTALAAGVPLALSIWVFYLLLPLWMLALALAALALWFARPVAAGPASAADPELA